MCISEAIYVGCEHLAARPVGRLVLKGKTQSLMVYEPVVEAEAQTRAPLADYREAYELLAAQRLNGLDPAEALRAFVALAALFPQDPLVALHLNRLQQGETGDEMVMTAK
jgi:adenylate cyclase